MLYTIKFRKYKPQGLYFSKALFEGLIFGGAYIRGGGGLIYGGKFAFQNHLGLYYLHLKINWASLKLNGNYFLCQ